MGGSLEGGEIPGSFGTTGSGTKGGVERDVPGEVEGAVVGALGEVGGAVAGTLGEVGGVDDVVGGASVEGEGGINGAGGELVAVGGKGVGVAVKRSNNT
ncbi:MAG: hypothetical protein KAI39_08215 [Desulfobulbaceae bacterium]|nr:hypothetical protein [Desulfobulbaceae bacterium]